MRLPGIGFTSASCSAYITQNGVSTPTTSPGSNHAGGERHVERPAHLALGLGLGRAGIGHHQGAQQESQPHCQVSRAVHPLRLHRPLWGMFESQTAGQDRGVIFYRDVSRRASPRARGCPTSRSDPSCERDPDRPDRARDCHPPSTLLQWDRGKHCGRSSDDQTTTRDQPDDHRDPGPRPHPRAGQRPEERGLHAAARVEHRDRPVRSRPRGGLPLQHQRNHGRRQRSPPSRPAHRPAARSAKPSAPESSATSSPAAAWPSKSQSPPPRQRSASWSNPWTGSTNAARALDGVTPRRTVRSRSRVPRERTRRRAGRGRGLPARTVLSPRSQPQPR